MTKSKILEEICAQILAIQKTTPILIGIDGVDGAGKTTFAKSLTEMLKQKNAQVLSASVDNFHNPREVRYKRGENSPEGFFYDSYNYDLLKEYLLNPFTKNEGKYRLTAFDHITNSQTNSIPEKVHNNNILIVEGIFLFRPEIINYWDFKILLTADFNTTLKRDIQRTKSKSKTEVTNKFNTRYRPGQEIYSSLVNLKEKANLIIDNTDYNKPKILLK
jgi:uridine kinase